VSRAAASPPPPPAAAQAPGGPLAAMYLQLYAKDEGVATGQAPTIASQQQDQQVHQVQQPRHTASMGRQADAPKECLSSQHQRALELKLADPAPDQVDVQKDVPPSSAQQQRHLDMFKALYSSDAQ